MFSFFRSRSIPTQDRDQSHIGEDRRTRLTLTTLEDRLTPYVLSGFSWADTNVSASFAPDGTQVGSSSTSSLFTTLDAVAPTATWQREFARALQTWAQYTPLNFRIVPDDGTKWGDVWEPIQGSTRFGDIRLFARPLASNVLGATDFPTNGSTASGDIQLNSTITYRIGSGPDLYSVLLHESGHSLGLDHSTTGTVMFGAIWGVYSGLTADDIAGIQAIYGTRSPDAFDAAGSNDSRDSATVLSLSSGSASVRADLTTQADVDYYKVVASGSSLTVSVDARNLSLLAPKVSVYTSNGVLLGTTSADYGQAATLNLTGLTAGQSYYLVADGATNDVFGMGAYKLDARFGGSVSVSPPQAPGTLTATAASSTQINLAWQDNATNEDGFRIESSTDGITFTPVGTTGANVGSYSVTGLAAGTTYYFRVLAYNAGGDSAWSNTAQAMTQTSAPATPLAPSSLVATAVSSSQINVTWQDNATNEDGFRVESSTDGVNFTLAGTVGTNATSYSVGGLTAGTMYYFRVRAYNAGGNSSWSNIAQATAPAAPPPPTLPPDRFEVNDTAVTAGKLGKINSTSQTGLTIQSATDVDWYTFTINSSGTFAVSITFQNSVGNLDLYLFNAQLQPMAGSVTTADRESLTVSLSSGQSYYLKVVSPNGGVNTYDLAIARLGGKTSGGKTGGNLLDGLPLNENGRPRGFGAASTSLPIGTGSSGDQATPTVEFLPRGDESGRSERPGWSIAKPVAVRSQAMRLLLELDLPLSTRAGRTQLLDSE